MNLLDWIFVILISLSIVFGFFRGLIKGIFSIVAKIIGLICAGLFYGNFSPIFTNFGLGETPAKIISFIIILVAVYILIILGGKLMHKIVEAVDLGWLNRLGGVASGFIRGLIISSIIIIVLTMAVTERSSILVQSRLAPYVMEISKILLILVPEEISNRFFEKEKEFKDFWDLNTKPEKRKI